jgi:HEAT repeat protein
MAEEITEAPSLTRNQRARGKRLYYVYGFFNSISWAALGEGVVILVLLRLGATESWVGLVVSLQYVTLPAMAIGYLTVPKIGVTGTAGLFWGIRSCSALLMIVAPWMMGMGPTMPLWFMLFGSLGFMLGRAAGLSAFTGIITELTTTRDRGELISNSAKIAQFASILMTAFMAAYLGAAAPLYRYQIFITTGMFCGLIGAFALWKVPEAGLFKTPHPPSLLKELKWSVATRGRRWFMAMMIGIPITQGVTYVFGVLIAKQGYGLSDQGVVLYVLIGIVGGIIASYTYSLFLDQLGSRPMLVLTSFLDLAGVLLVVLLPKTFNPYLIAALFFINGYIHIAFLASIQHYFISISNRTHQLAHGIITRGFGGIVGGVALAFGGWALEQLKLASIGNTDPLLHFRYFYAGLLILLIIRTLIFFKLPTLKSQGVRSSLSALFSPWDWRAISAVKRAIAVQSETEESKALTAMMKTGSAIYQEDLERYLKSPSIFVRQRAMGALERAKPDQGLISILERDLAANEFTTAHHAAHWLGRWRVTSAVPSLCQAVESNDHLLSGAAIHALVALEEQKQFPLIEKRFNTSVNPFVIIEGARAVSLWGDRRHYKTLLDKYLLKLPPQTQDELSLSVARLLGLYDTLYQDLGMWRREPSQLFQEWQERFSVKDRNGLFDVIRNNSVDLNLLKKSLEQRKENLHTWFYEDTGVFLDKLEAQVWPEMVFILTFLFLSKNGLHYH